MTKQFTFWNHCLEGCYGPFPVPRDDALFASRVYCLTRKEDIIQLPPDIKPFQKWIAGHYERAGISISQNIVWSRDYSLARLYPDYLPSVYFFGQKAHEIWPNKLRLDITEEFNNKLKASERFARLAESANPSFVNFHRGKDEIQNLNDFGGKHNFIKGAYSVGGSLVFSCKTFEEYQHVINAFDPLMPLQFQKAIIQPDGKPGIPVNLFYYISDSGPRKIVATQQILDGYSHVGNIYPTVHQPWRVTNKIAADMFHKGMRGHVSFNLIALPKRKGKYSYWIIECNPRWGASAHFKYLGDRLGVDSWCTTTVKTTKTDLNEISFKSFEFNPKTRQGAVVVNWGTIILGKLQVFLAGKPEEWSQLLQNLEEIL